MEKYLLLLLLLLLRINDVQAGCYYSQSSGGIPVYGTIFANEGQALQVCQQLACSIWPTMQGCPSTCTPETQTQNINCESGYNGSITQTNTKSCPSGAWSGWVTTSNTCVSTCVQVSQTQTISCPANQTGSITQTNTKTCPTNQWQGWVTTSNTCVQNAATCQASSQSQGSSCPIHQSGSIVSTRTSTCPDPYGSPVWGSWSTQNSCVQDPPTCKITSESQSLQCQTGYIGLITQTRTSSCPDPYGQPVFAPWVTISDTCKKSATNPTNPVSPVNPNSPVNQTTAPVAITQPAAVQQVMSNPVTSPVESPQTTTAPTASPTTSTTSTQTPSTPTPLAPKKSAQALGRVLSLEQKGIVSQTTNPFPAATINQEIPLEIRQNNKFLLDILSSGTITESIRINQITKDTVEYEQ